MRKNFISALTVAVFIATAFYFFISPAAIAESLNIIGDVKSVDESANTITVQEDQTLGIHTLKASKAKLASIIPGYRVEVKAKNGKVTYLEVLGLPQNDSTPITITTQNGKVINIERAK